MVMYTDPRRLRATDPGTVENNPVWTFHRTVAEETLALTKKALRQDYFQRTLVLR